MSRDRADDSIRVPGQGPATSRPGDNAPGIGAGDDIEVYLREAARDRRQRMRRAALVPAVGAVACVILATQMTDIGHATGFFGLGVALLVGAGIISRAGRSP